MNDKKPETLTIEQIRDRLSETVDERQLPILADGVALLSRGRNLFGKAVEVQIPYRLPGVRLGVLMAGEADVMINLMSYHVEAPAAVFIGDNSIFQLQSIASDSEVQGVFVDQWAGARFHYPHQSGCRRKDKCTYSSAYTHVC